MKLLLVLLGTVASLTVATGSASARGVFVNEIHYDNAGVDQDEGIEVAGPAGVDLSGYSVEFYSGEDGARYSTISLFGTLPDQQNGYGTRFFAATELQNGAPDGLALLGPAGVEGLLGYEGTFVATDGSAMGMALNSIGRFEAPSTPVGLSLQLQGTGNTSPNFAWKGPLAATPGQVNTGQQFLASPSAPPTSAPPTPPVVDDLRPRLSTFAISPATFRAGHRGSAVSGSIGGRVFYRLSEQATTTFTVQRARTGRRRARRCLKQGAGKTCTRWVTRRGRFTRLGAAGINSFRFKGRLGRRALPPGRYRLVAVATDAAQNRSSAVKRRFRIVK